MVLYEHCLGMLAKITLNQSLTVSSSLVNTRCYSRIHTSITQEEFRLLTAYMIEVS